MSEAIEELKAGIQPMLTRMEQMEPIIAAIVRQEMKLSYTALSNFAESPKDFADYKLQAKIETPAMIYGSMLHCLILEPDEFENRYFALDDTEIIEQIGGAKPRATKKYKEWKAEKSQEAGERKIISPQDYIHAKIVAGNVKHNRASAKVMHLCPQHEVPIEWEYLNFLFKGFIDMLGENDVADIKSLPDAQQDKVQREIWYRELHIQAAMYQAGLNALDEKLGRPQRQRRYHIIGVDKLGGTSVHQLKPSLIQHGAERYEELVTKFNYAIYTKAWDQSYDFWAERWDGLFDCDKAGWMY